MSSVLSITSTGDVYVFELRPESGAPTTAVASVDPRIRQTLKAELEHTIQLLYHFYRGDVSPDELADQPDRLRSLGRLIYANLLPDVIREALRQLPIDQPLILSTNDAELPWELAYDGRQYLGTRWVIGRELRLLTGQQPRQNAPPPSRSWKALLVANPTGDLPATSEEVEALTELIERHLPQRADVHILAGPRATKRALQMELAGGEYRLIHYSGHAVFEKDAQDRSGLVLAGGEILTAREIQDCLDGQPWVFLNACAEAHAATAEAEEGGPSYAGVEAYGLASAFILGGARAVIGTLWSVPDRGAQAFASAVYEELFRGRTAGETLKRTRDAFWRDRPQDPIWAAYVLYAPPDLSLIEAKRQERRIATVLTSEIRGLAALQEHLPLERVMEISDRVLADLTKQVNRYGGEVIRTDQAGLTAVFGARPLESAEEDGPLDEPAERAVRAALALQRAVNQILHTHPDLRNAPLEITLGLATGTIVLNRARGSLLGLPVEQATWLVEQADPGKILATEGVLHTARDLFVSQPWSRQRSLPAHLEPSSIREVLGPRAAVPEGFLGPLVGRERELQSLADAWRQTQDGHGQVINVVGGAGIGKSRLIYEFSQRLAAEVAQRRPGPVEEQVEGWFMARCPSREQQAATYALIAALVRSLIGVDADEDSAIVRRTVRDSLAHGPSIEPDDVDMSTVVLCGVLGLPAQGSDPPQPEDPQARRGQVVRALRQLLASFMHERPLVLILDDLHKVDELSEEVLERLVEGIDRYPLLVLAVYRPDWEPAWSDRRFVSTMTLDRLSRDESTSLVTTHFQHLVPVEIAEAVADWTGGNPLFVAEVVRTLQESGVLVRHNGSWHLTQPLAEIQIPHSVQEVIQDRVGRLSCSARQVIEAAATLGVEFSKQFLVSMLEGLQAPAVIEDNLQTLEQRDLIQYDWMRDELRFTHDLVQAAVYAHISPEEQRAYHHRAAEAWLRTTPKTETAAEPVAHHRYRSVTEAIDGRRRVLVSEISPTALERAAVSLVAAGDHARANYANQTAGTYYQQAQAVIQALGQSQDRRWVDCFEGLGEAASRLGDFSEALASLEHAFGMLRRGRMTPEDRRHAADLARRIGRIQAIQGNTAAALGWMEEGFLTLGVRSGGSEGLTDPEDQACAALLHIHSGSTHYLQGDFETALEECRRGLALAEEVDTQRAIAEGSNLLGAILDARGEPQRALEHYQRSYALYEAMQDRYHLARVADNMGTAYYYLGNWEAAREYHERSLTFWEQIEDQDSMAYAYLNLGVLDLHQGNWKLARAGFDHALELSEKVRNQRMIALAHNNLGLLHIKQEGWQRAQQHLKRSRDLSLDLDIRDVLPETYRGLAEVALGQRGVEEAIDLAQQSIALADELDMRLERAVAMRTLGRAYEMTGDIPRAREHLHESLSILEDLPNDYEIGRTLYHLAVSDVDIGNDQQAQDHLQHATEIFERLNARKDLERARTALQA